MTQQALIRVMIYYLEALSPSGTIITKDTIHNSVLSASDGIGNAHSKHIYKSLVRWSIRRAGGADKTWPSNWIDISVESLASKLI